MPRLKRKLGTLVEKLVAKAGMTKTEFSKKCGMPRHRLNNILYVRDTLYPSQAMRIAKAAGVAPDILTPFLAEAAPHGSVKAKRMKKEARTFHQFEVSCPHCEGTGAIMVRKV